jgi:hypothetical protein
MKERRTTIQEIESLTGIVFEDLSNREIRGALMALDALKSIDPSTMSLEEYFACSEAVVAENLILDGYYEDGKGDLGDVR